uniref:Uncharacterized protein MANES_12G143800 n=1 Tax=Rhizophora mucronata TaxID=61149 RepID=A0A2P2M6F8_RHIMU
METACRYYEGQLTPISEEDFENDDETAHIRVTEAAEKVSLLEENIKPRTDLPHLLVHLRERQPEKLHYLGVSFGLTLELFRFWWKHKFAPFYIGHVPSAVTGEHTCMMLRPLNSNEFEVHGSDQWGFFGPFYKVFKRKFARQLTYCFRTMEYKLAMSVLDPKINFTDMELEPPSFTSEGIWRSLSDDISAFDMKMLKDFADNLLDYRVMSELVPILARIYFREKLPVTLSYAQASLLLCMGLQLQDITCIQEQTKLERTQILSLFVKIMKKFHKYLYGIASNEILSSLPEIKERHLVPHSISVGEDLSEAAKQVEEKMKNETENLLNPDLLQRYAILDKESDLENALQNGRKMPASGVVSVKSNRSEAEKHGKPEGHERGKKRSKEHTSKSNKKVKS